MSTGSIKPNLLIIDPAQFGYHSDTYYYCKHLRSDFNISYYGFDENKKAVPLEQITLITIKKKQDRILRELRFIAKACRLIRKGSFDFVHVNYFKGCSALHLCVPNKRMLVDVRSASILTESWKRAVYDFFLKAEVRSFQNIGVISSGLAKRLSLPARHIITPLGADIISHKSKPKNIIKFLYVGTFYNRNLHHTILGFKQFFEAYSHQIQISYTIVGDGPSDELENLQELVKKLGFAKHIHLTGRIPQNKLKPFFDSHNIGISYVPITDYYHYQPPTKTFEYLLSGMPVIATRTHENTCIINENNGVLIHDTPTGVYLGMNSLYSKLNQLDAEKIQQQSVKYSWKYIVKNLSEHYKKILTR
jgi:glycosyltransferase involved in cell wall biosynthesis